MSSAAKFVHLRLHSEYSLLQGAMRLKSLPDLCVEENMPAVAVTDKNNLFCALEFYFKTYICNSTASRSNHAVFQGCFSS